MYMLSILDNLVELLIFYLNEKKNATFLLKSDILYIVEV